MTRPFLRLFLAAAAIALAGCASAPKFAPGQALLRGETLKLPPAPDSLRAELELTAFAEGRASTASAAFSAKPYRGYKLDLFGVPGMVAASFLWNPQHWTLVLFEREGYAEGAGEHAEFGNLGLHDASVHDLFSFLWGGFLPGWVDTAATAPALVKRGEGRYEYTAEGYKWRVEMDANGLVREAAREDSALRIVYSDYQAMGVGTLAARRIVPAKAKLFRYRDPLLEIRVKSLEDNPHWKRDPFTIKVPKGFAKLERVGGDAGR